MTIKQIVRPTKLDARGVAHHMIPLAVAVIVAIGGVYSVVASHAATKTTPKKSSSSKHRLTHKKVKAKRFTGAKVRFNVIEVVAGADGKILPNSAVPRGNVVVTLSSTDKTARCFDAGHFFRRNNGLIFAGKTDAKKSHKKNVGHIQVDKCAPATYTAKMVLSDKYEAIGSDNTTFKLGKSQHIINFAVKKKGQAATPEQAKQQSAEPTPTPAPVTPPEPITPAQEKKAVDQTSKFETDMFFANMKLCSATGDDDLGDTLANRQKKYDTNKDLYMTASLKAYVADSLHGDAFPLLGVNDLHCGQYELIQWQQTTPLETSNDGTHATVQHAFTAKARAVPYGNYEGKPAQDVNRTWTYNLVRNGDNWQIESISVSSH